MQAGEIYTFYTKNYTDGRKVAILGIANNRSHIAILFRPEPIYCNIYRHFITYSQDVKKIKDGEITHVIDYISNKIRSVEIYPKCCNKMNMQFVRCAYKSSTPRECTCLPRMRSCCSGLTELRCTECDFSPISQKQLVKDRHIKSWKSMTRKERLATRNVIDYCDTCYLLLKQSECSKCIGRIPQDMDKQITCKYCFRCNFCTNIKNTKICVSLDCNEIVCLNCCKNVFIEGHCYCRKCLKENQYFECLQATEKMKPGSEFAKQLETHFNETICLYKQATTSIISTDI